MVKVINLYNMWHLGDAVFVMIYLYNCKDYIIKHNITVNFYIKQKHVSQIKEFRCCSNVHIMPLDDSKCKTLQVGNKNVDEYLKQLTVSFNLCSLGLPNDSIDTFPGYYATYNYYIKDLTFLKKNEHKKPLNDFYVEYYSDVLGKRIDFPKIKEFSYTDKDLLVRYNKFPKKYRNNDILIINSVPQSNQYDLKTNKKEFNKMICTLADKYNVITTAKLKDISCTLDGGLTIKDIAAISAHVKYIIAINTGPLTACLNTYALKNVKKWFIFDIIMPFIYDNFYINKSFDEIIESLD